MAPDLFARVRLYETEEGGKSVPVLSGYRCPCMGSASMPLVGFDARLQPEGGRLEPGDEGVVGFNFLSPEGKAAISEAGRFSCGKAALSVKRKFYRKRVHNLQGA